MYYYMISNEADKNKNICVATEKEATDTEAVEIAKTKSNGKWSTAEFANSKVCRISRKDYDIFGYDIPSIRLYISDDWFIRFQRLTGIKDVDCDDIADYIWKLLEAKAAESDYNITSTLSLSTHHLKEETFQKLLWEPLQHNLGLSVYVTDEVEARFWISDDPSDYFSGKSIPKDLWKCICFAHKLGCQWISFSEDHEEVPDLPVYKKGK